MRCSTPICLKDKAGNIVYVPCGQCMPCRLNLARAWTDRICMEAMCHEHNCFITLTYDDEHLPNPPSLNVRDVQLFLKRFRKAYNSKVRYYLCGEYGEIGMRPHYHAVLFGVDYLNSIFKNLQKCKSGYSCDLCSWDKGFVNINDFNEKAARYVAGYVTKKLRGKRAVEYTDAGLIAPFALKSLKPGLGFDYFKAHLDTYKQYGYLLLNGHKLKACRYFAHKFGVDTLMDKIPDEYKYAGGFADWQNELSADFNEYVKKSAGSEYRVDVLRQHLDDLLIRRMEKKGEKL